MASRLIVLAAALAASQAAPFWFADNGLVPGTIVLREGRSPDFEEPSFAYGLGLGISSKIGGVGHSFSVGDSFQSGNAQAVGEGISSAGGNVFAKGVGYASANPSAPVYRTTYPGYSPYNGLRHSYGNNYGVAAASTQNLGGVGTAVAHNSPYGSAATAVQNGGHNQNAISHAQNFGSNGFGTAISTAQSRDANGFNNVIAVSQNGRGYQASTAHTVQQNGGGLQQTGATSINAPGIQASHSHSVNTGGYY